MTIAESAKRILIDFGEPLHLNDICKKIENQGLYSFTSSNKEQAVGRAISEKCKGNKGNSDVIFYRVSKATYGLIEWDTNTPDEFDYESFIPAKELYNFILNSIPIINNSWLSVLDNIFEEDGQLESVFYQSMIFYSCRRFVQKAKLITMPFGSVSGVFDSTKALEILREEFDSLSNKSVDVERLAWLLRECIRESKHMLSPTSIKRRLNKAEQNNERCYLCGKELDYSFVDPYDSAEIEHIWPKSMGGSNTFNNLAISCSKCNKTKEDVWGSEDFHFEKISYLNVKSSFKYQHRLSIIMRDSSQCSICEKKATEVGKLYLLRKKKDDVWHYTNMISVCSDHLEDQDEFI